MLWKFELVSRVITEPLFFTAADIIACNIHRFAQTSTGARRPNSRLIHQLLNFHQSRSTIANMVLRSTIDPRELRRIAGKINYRRITRKYLAPRFVFVPTSVLQGKKKEICSRLKRFHAVLTKYRLDDDVRTSRTENDRVTITALYNFSNIKGNNFIKIRFINYFGRFKESNNY